MTARLFVPPHPPRPEGPVATWRGLIGERGRTAVYGWSKRAFATPGFTRDVFGFRVHVISHPDWIGQALLDHQRQLVKPDITRRLLAPVIGEGLLTAEGDLWREERRIVAASFTPGAVDGHRRWFEQAATNAMAGWRDGAVRDLADESTHTTMNVIALALFGGDPRLVSHDAMHNIADALAGFSQPRMQAVLGLPLVPVGWTAFKGWRGQRRLRQLLGQVVDDRIAGRTDDWLAALVRALMDRFEPARARALAIDNAATFYLAGHETTANALSWTMYLLGEQPELQEELAAEATAARASADWGKPSLPARLPRLHAAFQEAMRLYPPVPRFDRQATAPMRIGDFDVGPGDIVSIWPWIVHRHRDWWADPDAFVADRFLTGEGHRFQYIPFGGGPRICVGANFATIEALTVLAIWLSRWRFESVGDPVRASGGVTLRPSPGVRLRTVSRN